MRERILARVTHHIGGSQAEVLQQSFIRLGNDEFRVVRQDCILDRIKGVHPLPLRAQYLLQQPQILRGNPDLARCRVQKIHLFQ